MKTFGRFLFIAVFTNLLFACSELPQFSDDNAGMELKKAPLNEGQVFTVYPSGDDDTPSLNLAFNDAIAAGPGSVVQLVEGTYHLNFIEIREFSGKFRGAGKGKTIITTINDLGVDFLISQKLNTVLIRFVGGDVYMGEMTLQTPPGALSTGAENYIDGLVGFSARTYQYNSINDHINAVVNNVEFTGYWENINHGLKAEYGVRGDATVPGGWPLSHMDISVTNCSFDGFYFFGAVIEHVNEGKIIAGTKNNGNIFNNNGATRNVPYETGGGGSLGIWSNVNVKISIAGNTFFVPEGTRWGIEMFSSPVPARLQQVPQTKVTTCNIEQNVFNISGGAGGLLINDRRRYFFPDDLPMLVEVKSNNFILSNNTFTGIGSANMKGMVIRNNKFEGSGQFGVRVMGPLPYPYNENGLMLGNNLSFATFSVASVLLDKRTNNWTIVGGNLSDTIVNLGENNLISGMNISTSEVPLGKTIVDNLEEMREVRR